MKQEKRKQDQPQEELLVEVIRPLTKEEADAVGGGDFSSAYVS